MSEVVVTAWDAVCDGFLALGDTSVEKIVWGLVSSLSQCYPFGLKSFFLKCCPRAIGGDEEVL